MSKKEVIKNIIRLMTSFHFEIKALPDDLKCAKCKSVLRNACQMPCGCRFCRTCIDDVISRGDQFCPGDSQECSGTPLSTAQRDYRANKSVLKLIAKCPYSGCSHECPLIDMEGHMHVCSSKNIDCPFRELGCTQGVLPGEEISGHLLQESRGHIETLIGTVANISKDMDVLKQELLLKDEQRKYIENVMKLIIDENKSIKDENKSINCVNKLIQIDIISVKDEIESIKIENESIKREKEVLCGRVRQLEEKLDREIDERYLSDEQDSAMATVVTGAVTLGTEMEPVKDDIRSIRFQCDPLKCQMESIQMSVGLEQLDDWLIDENVDKTAWDWLNAKTSGRLGGVTLHYAFELVSRNFLSRGGKLEIYLLIWAGPSDRLLQWPFRGAVTITVADKDRRGPCSRQTRQCIIYRPSDNRYNWSDLFEFRHGALKGAGLYLRRGLRVSCHIIPGPGQ